MIWLLPHPSKPVGRNTERIRKRANLLTGEGGGGRRRIIRQRESLFLYNSFQYSLRERALKTTYSGKIRQEHLSVSNLIPVTGEGDRVEDHAFAASIPPALPADAEEEELAVCSRKSS
jgi:hypothetical protein